MSKIPTDSRELQEYSLRSDRYIAKEEIIEKLRGFGIPENDLSTYLALGDGLPFDAHLEKLRSIGFDVESLKKSDPPKFFLAPIDNLQLAELHSILPAISNEQEDFVFLYAAAQRSLKRCEGVKDSAGELIVLSFTEMSIRGLAKRQIVDDHSMNKLKQIWIYELGAHILRNAKLSGDQRKN